MPSLFYLVPDLVISVGLIVLAGAVLIRNDHAVMNRIFAAFSASVGVWIMANYVSNDINLAKPVILVADYAVFSFSCIASITLVWFTILLAEDTRSLRIFRKLLPVYIACVLISMTPLVTSDVVLQQDVWAVKFGIGVAAYGLALIGSIAWAFVVATVGIRRGHGEQHDRLKYYLIFLYLSVLPTLILDFIVPAATGVFAITNIAILPMLILVVGMYYISIRHQLFDLRLFVVRAAAYVLSLAVISLIYLVPITYLAAHILDIKFGWSEFVVLALSGVGFSLLYHYGRVLFDQVTLHVFYRGYYSSQTVLDKLSDLMVRTVDLDELKQGSGKIITQAIGTKLCDFWLHDGKPDKQLERAEKLFNSVGSLNVIVLDELEDHEVFKRTLSQDNVAAIVRLRITHGNLGYMVLGFKESGGQYSLQDKQLLSTAADEVAVGLQNALHFSEIQGFNKTLQTRIVHATSELKRTNMRLRELDDTKDDFIGMASHQLRTPLTSVKGYLSMVLEGDAGELNGQQRKLLQQSYNSSQQMVYLISDLLNLSRLKTGKFVIESTPVNLADLVQNQYEQLREIAKAKNIHFSYERPEHFPFLMLDESKLQQAVMNLADNALHYTPNGGEVVLSLRETPDAVEYMVRDTGIGVPKREQHNLFGKMFRASNAQKNRPDGTGIGLFMVKKVAVAEGGSIIFESTEGKGSTFGFKLPKARLRVTADESKQG